MAVVCSFPVLCEYSSLYLPVLLLKGVWVVSRFWLLRNSTFVGLSFGGPTYAFFPRTSLRVESIGCKVGECSAFRDATSFPMWLCMLLSHQ